MGILDRDYTKERNGDINHNFHNNNSNFDLLNKIRSFNQSSEYVVDENSYKVNSSSNSSDSAYISRKESFDTVSFSSSQVSNQKSLARLLLPPFLFLFLLLFLIKIFIF